MNIFLLGLICLNIHLSFCSLEISIGTFISSTISSDDFIKNINAAFYWSKTIYRFIKDIKSAGEKTEPNMGIISKELLMLNQKMQASLMETRQILFDQHFQSHIELPTFALYRHVTNYVLNPTTISENEFIDACSRRHSPNDILSNLSLLLQKQWILNRFKTVEYNSDDLVEVEIFMENLIKQLIIAQSFCIEVKYGSDSDNYQISTVKIVDEMKMMIIEQIKALNDSFKKRLQMPCKQKKGKSAKDKSNQTWLIRIIKSPYYLGKSIFNFLFKIIKSVFFFIYSILTYIFYGIKFIIIGFYNIFIQFLSSIYYGIIYLANFIISLISYGASFITVAFSYLLNSISIIVHNAFDLIFCSIKPVIASIIVTAIYDDFYGEQRLRNFVGYE